MEMAKVTSKGQITIPVSIRRRLSINEGDKLLFIDRPEGVVMVNPDLLPGGSKEELAAGAAADATGRPQAKRRAAPTSAATAPEPEAAPQASAAPVPGQAAASAAPAEEPGKPTKPKSFNLDTLLDEIRSIGSNI